MKRPGPSRGNPVPAQEIAWTFTNTTPLPSLHHCWKHMLQTILFYLTASKKCPCCACQAWDARSHARERVGTTRLTARTLGHSRLVACSKSPDRMASVRKHVLGQKHLYWNPAVCTEARLLMVADKKACNAKQLSKRVAVGTRGARLASTMPILGCIWMACKYMRFSGSSRDLMEPYLSQKPEPPCASTIYNTTPACPSAEPILRMHWKWKNVHSLERYLRYLCSFLRSGCFTRKWENARGSENARFGKG